MKFKHNIYHEKFHRPVLHKLSNEQTVILLKVGWGEEILSFLTYLISIQRERLCT